MTRRSVGRVTWIAAAAGIAAATLSPSNERVSGSVSLCIICGDMGGVDALLNVLLFVPLGAGLALAGTRAARAIPAIVFATILIELLQLGVIPGRDASVGDVLTNSLGGVIGFLVGAQLDQLARPSPRRAPVLVSAWLCGWLLLQAVAGYSLRSRPTESTYFGQLARALGGKPAYSGRVLTATIGGVPIPDDRFDDSRRAADALGSASGAEVSVAVVPRRSAAQRLAIVRVADQEEREVLNLGADKTDLVVGIRTGASTLRLRSVLVALRGVFADRSRASADGGSDTVRIRTRYGLQRVEMYAAHAGRDPQVVAVGLTTAKAWRLFSPVVVYADGSAGQSVLDALWLFFSLAPAGFWAAFALRGAYGFRLWTRIAAGASALAVGLAVIPAVAQLAPTVPTEWLGAIAGAVVGGAAGRAMSGQSPETNIVE